MSGPRPVVVAGAGLAGLAAAAELSCRGIPVCVLEQKRHGGGRAYSFTDSTTGETIDNGQHALIAGYAATMRYLELIGTRALLRPPQARPSLAFHHPVRGLCRFTLAGLPPPFHLLGGILTTDLFSPADRFRLLRAGRALMRAGDRAAELSGLTVEAWLHRTGQSPETIRSFWEPLAIAVMNERTGRASALLFARCLRRAFLGGRNDAALVLPPVGLSELFVDPACRYIRDRGGRVIFGARVAAVILEGGRATGVRLQDGSLIEASAVILAVPGWSIGPLLPPEMPGLRELQQASGLPVSPIISLHLWYRRDFPQEAAIGVIGRTVQWIFNRRKIEEKGGQGGHLSCVISAAGDLVDGSNEKLTAIAVEDVQAVYGISGETLVHTSVIRERRATFSPRPDVEPMRPGQLTEIGNLFLAGDWTSTGLPGTIEGAVWSGQRCVELVQAQQLHVG